MSTFTPEFFLIAGPNASKLKNKATFEIDLNYKGPIVLGLQLLYRPVCLHGNRQQTLCSLILRPHTPFYPLPW